MIFYFLFTFFSRLRPYLFNVSSILNCFSSLRYSCEGLKIRHNLTLFLLKPWLNTLISFLIVFVYCIWFIDHVYADTDLPIHVLNLRPNYEVRNWLDACYIYMVENHVRTLLQIAELQLTIVELLDDLPSYTELDLYELPRGVYYTDTLEYLLLLENYQKTNDLNILDIIAVKHANYTMQQYLNIQDPDAFRLHLIENMIRLLKMYTSPQS